MSKANVVQVVGEKIVPVAGPIVLGPVGQPATEATVIGLDFALRKMDRMHKDAIAIRSKKHPLDASMQAYLLGADGQAIGPSGFLYWNQAHYAGGVVQLVPVGPLTRFHSTFKLRLGAIPEEVERIVLVSSVHDNEHHHIGVFGAMSLYLCKPTLEPIGIQLYREFPRKHGSVVLGTVERADGNWQFVSGGETVEGGLKELCARYGIRVVEPEEEGKDDGQAATPAAV